MPGNALAWGWDKTNGIWVQVQVDANGKPIIANPQYTTPANTGVNVTTASTAILAANSDRLYAIIVNASDTLIYLGIGAAAVAGKGIYLKANGGSYEINWTNLYTGAIYGIHGGSGNKVVTVVEGD